MVHTTENFLIMLTKEFSTDAFKTTSKSAIQKTAEASGDLIGNKIVDRITEVSQNLNQNHSRQLQMRKIKEDMNLQKKGRKLLMN